jgi:hypothetical protein
MKLPKDELEPIMTNSEDIVRFGPNAYTKPATALNILRETIMGRPLFDFAFKEYARRWEFKHPTPADFFRTMEDASGENLDWFWRGWFYGTDPCDIALDSVKVARADVNGDLPPSFNRPGAASSAKVAPPAVNSYEDISKIRNREDKTIKFYVDKDTTVRDFYWKYDRGLASVDSSKFRDYTTAKNAANGAPETFTDDEKAKFANKYFYELNFSNKGGLVMPIIVQFTYTDGSKTVDRIPAQIWRLNEKHVSKFYVQDKEVASIQLDPFRETCDIDETNNYWGKLPAPSKFQVFKQKTNAAARGQSAGVNPMQVSGRK